MPNSIIASDILQVVGKSPRRIEAIEKVTGRAKFTGDLEIPGMLQGLVLRSPYPHALIESIDARHAASLPGVVGVLTREDIKDINPYYGHCLRDRPLIAIDRVLYVGEPVAAVAAETKLVAEKALSLIQIKYKELPVLANVDDALAPGAQVLHEQVQGAGEFHELKSVASEEKTNICHHEHIEAGDIERGFAESDDIFEDVFEFPMIYHYTMEPHVGIAKVDSDFITLWTSSAHPFLIRSEIAQMFGYPLSQVSVVVPYVGGAYGGKSYFKIEPLVVALARKAGRPVRIEQTVPESMLTIRRHSARCRIKTGVKHDGTLVAREAEILLDTGAYADNGPRVAKRAAIRVHGPYRIPHYKIDVLAVYTNTVPAGSMRSIGGPQSIWPLESQMDIIAERLGIDPVELRVKNLVTRGEQIRAGVKPMDADLVMGLKKAASAIGWNRDQIEPKQNLGVAVGVSDSEASPVSTSIVRLLSDGSVILLAGSTEVGQGTRTVLCQIVAEELKTSLKKVNMRATDTMYTPFDRSTGASRSTTVMGTAVKAAATDLRNQLVEIGAELLGVDVKSIVLQDGAITSGAKRLEYGQAVIKHFAMAGGELIGRGYVRAGGGIDPTTPIFWEIGMGATEVDIDTETGQISIVRYISIADVGKAINPRQCEAQDEGAAMMGIGHTLFESLNFEGGQPLNANLVDYRVPTFSDLPDFETELIENRDGPGPYGAKGMGESGIVSVAPAVANAIARGAGIRIKRLPLRPETVWRALQRKRET